MKFPKYLNRSGRSFWKKVLTEFDMKDPHDLERLSLACECLDKIEEAREMIKAEGAFFVDRWNQPKEHPAQGTQRNNAILFSKLIRELGLDLETIPDSRPPRQY